VSEVYIVTYRTRDDVYNSRVGSVYFDHEAAQREAMRLESANSYVIAGVITRQVERPREWTERQKRWMRGRR